MKAFELLNFFLDRAPYVDRERSVDKIVFGDPESEVRRILVTWMADIYAIGKAIEIGADTIITHEPTLGSHENEYQTYLNWDDSVYKKETAGKKVKMLADNHITLIRNHDTWDRFPDIGISSSWAKFIGIEGKPVDSTFYGYQMRYDIKPVTLHELACQIAAKAALLDEPHIPYFGDGNMVVSKVGIGTGAICFIEHFVRMGCDVSIVCDDGGCFWDGITWARDTGHPVIRVAHATTEEPGMQNMCRYINENIKGVTAEYFRTPLRYHFI